MNHFIMAQKFMSEMLSKWSVGRWTKLESSYFSLMALDFLPSLFLLGQTHFLISLGPFIVLSFFFLLLFYYTLL